jgi:hypothetical protein
MEQCDGEGTVASATLRLRLRLRLRLWWWYGSKVTSSGDGRDTQYHVTINKQIS